MAMDRAEIPHPRLPVPGQRGLDLASQQLVVRVDRVIRVPETVALAQELAQFSARFVPHPLAGLEVGHLWLNYAECTDVSHSRSDLVIELFAVQWLCLRAVTFRHF